MTQAISLVNLVAASWADTFVRACWQGGLGIALLWLVCRLWPAMPPVPRCWLWRLAYAKLLLGLVWLPPLALPLLPHAAARPPAPPPALQAAPLERYSPALKGQATRVQSPSGAEENNRADLTAADLPAPSAPMPLPPARSTLPTVQTCLLALWLLGVLVSLERVTTVWRRARVLYAASAPLADEALQSDAADLCRRLGLGRVPPLRVAGGLASPVLLGLTRPAVLLPAFVLSGSPRPELRLMLAHELAHLARRDLLWNVLPQTAQRFFFFHPLVWLAEHEWSLAQEIACDALAVETTGTPPAAYGRMLLGIATRRTSAPLFPTLAVAAPRHTLRRRLFAMQHIGTTSRPRVILAAALTTALALGGLLPWRVVAQSGPSPSTPAAASQSEATRQRNILKERADIASKNTQLDAQLAEIQKNLSPAQLKKVQPGIDSMNALYAKQQQRVQLLEQSRAEYATTHPNRLSDEQIAFIRHFNWFQWKPTRIRANIRREQITKRKLQAHLASTHDARSRRDDEQQIAAIDQRRRQGEQQIRDWQPIIDRDRAQIALLPAEQSNRVAKLDSYDLDISVNRLDALMEKQVGVWIIRQRLAGKLPIMQQRRQTPTRTSLAQLIHRNTSAAQPNHPAPVPVQISPVMAEALDKEIAELEKQRRATASAAHPTQVADEGTVIAFLKARRAGAAWAQASIISPEFNPGGLKGQKLDNMRRIEQQAQRDKYIAEKYVFLLATDLTVQRDLHRLALLRGQHPRQMEKARGHASTAPVGLMHRLYYFPKKGHRVRIFAQSTARRQLVFDYVSHGQAMISPQIFVKEGEEVNFIVYDNGKLVKTR